MKVYVANAYCSFPTDADPREGYSTERWTIGVFSTEQLAVNAIEKNLATKFGSLDSLDLNHYTVIRNPRDIYVVISYDLCGEEYEGGEISEFILDES